MFSNKPLAKEEDVSAVCALAEDQMIEALELLRSTDGRQRRNLSNQRSLDT